MQILKYSEIDIEKINFDNIRKTPSGKGYTIYLKYEDNKPVYLQTPKLYTPYGVGIFNEDKEIPNYNLCLSLRNENEEKIKKFEDVLNSINDKVLAEMKSNENWNSCFNLDKEDLDDHVLTLMNRKIVKINDEDNFPPNINVTLNHRNDKFNFSVYEIKNENNKETPEKKELNFDNIKQLIPAKSYVRCIVWISNIWISGEKFGITLRLKQLAVYPQDDINGYYILSSSDDEN